VTDELRSMHGNIQWEVGKWKKQTGKLELCGNGFHASAKPLDSLYYNYGTKWFVAEARGEIVQDGTKLCAEEMRLIKEIPYSAAKRIALECVKFALYNMSLDDRNVPSVRILVNCIERYLKSPCSETYKDLVHARDAILESCASSYKDSACKTKKDYYLLCAAFHAAQAVIVFSDVENEVYSLDRNAKRTILNRAYMQMYTVIRSIRTALWVREGSSLFSYTWRVVTSAEDYLNAMAERVIEECLADS